jgi:uncharacterized protein (TIGR02246 family)
MRLLTYSLVALLLLGIAPAAWAGAAEELAEIGRQRSQAFVEGNLEAWMSWYADDAVVTSSLVPFRTEGKDAIRTYYAGLFQAYPTRRAASRQPATRVYNGDTTAVMNAYLQATLVDRNGQTNTLCLRQSVTWVKQDGRWLIVDAHTSRLPASP